MRSFGPQPTKSILFLRRESLWKHLPCNPAISQLRSEWKQEADATDGSTKKHAVRSLSLSQSLFLSRLLACSLCMCSMNRISQSWARAGCTKLCLLHYPRKIKCIYPLSLSLSLSIRYELCGKNYRCLCRLLNALWQWLVLCTHVLCKSNVDITRRMHTVQTSDSWSQQIQL